MPADAADGDLAAVAAALYAAPPAAFIAERTARVKAARGAGDRDLAARIGALPKPAASAGLVNRLVCDGGDDLHRILELGAALREAQQQPDPGRLRELGAQRRALLTEVTSIIADREQRRPGAAVLEEVQQTLQAALADEAAAAAVGSGRLLRALKADGLDPVDTAGAVAVPDLPTTAQRGPSRSPATSPAHDPDDASLAAESAHHASARQEAERQEADRRAAERAAAEAADRAHEAREAAGAARERAEAAESLVQQRTEDAARLRTELERLQGRLDAAEQDLAAAQESAQSAADEEADAARAADAAEEAARALRP